MKGKVTAKQIHVNNFISGRSAFAFGLRVLQGTKARISIEWGKIKHAFQHVKCKIRFTRKNKREAHSEFKDKETWVPGKIRVMCNIL